MQFYPVLPFSPISSDPTHQRMGYRYEEQWAVYPWVEGLLKLILKY